MPLIITLSISSLFCANELVDAESIDTISKVSKVGLCRLFTVSSTWCLNLVMHNLLKLMPYSI